MRKLLAVLLLVLLSASAEAATCYKRQTIYAFATSTTIVKTAYTVLIPDTVAVASCSYVVVTGAEWSSWNTAVTGVSSLNTRMTAAENTNTTQGDAITAAQNSADQANSTAGGMQSAISDLQAAVLALQNATGLSDPFDYAMAAAFWGFALSTVVALWYFSKNLGLLLGLVKRG